ncbi:hypothetical protein M0R45_020271 [Rubus argutus]|uniref:Uncharacterized protein n=1 Tax=Rubus argutus TaxID=59490 RepID=A0AAW1XB39_RUBAR
MDRVIRVLEGSDDHCPDLDIEVLIEKSMVTLFGRKLWMHDLILELGRQIVREECRGEPGKRSRLWDSEEIIKVFDHNKATSAIESIFLRGPTRDDVVHSINDSFSNMDKLRLLNIRNVEFSGNIKYLSNELQYLEWHKCPLDCFRSDFQPDKLVELRMPSSRIKQLWRGKKGWGMLRHIDMTGSLYLIEIPDFTEIPLLETLVLEACTSLVKVHQSLGSLKKLKYLNKRKCKSVESIPPFTSLESLETLNLASCSRLKMVPEIEGNMKSLSVLYLDGTSIEKLPPSVARLTGLTTLSLRHCSKLVEIPENLNCMQNLEQLDIGRTAIRDSSFLVGMKNLKSLYCEGCKGDAPRRLLSPASLSSLTSLIDLDLSDCNLMDEDIPDDLSSLISLRVLYLSSNCFVRLPESFYQLSKLETLFLRNCRTLELVPKKLPLSLEFVHAEGCTSLMDYPDQIKVLTSVESGVTTVNSLSDSSAIEDTKSFAMCFVGSNGEEPELLLLRNTEEEPVVRLSMSHPEYRKAVQSNSALQSLTNPFYSIGADNKIPVWFDHTSTSNSILIPTGDKKWKGVATCGVFSVNNTTADVEFSNYWYQITLETDVVSLEPFVFDRKVYEGVRPTSDLCLTHYEPSSSFPKSGLNASTVVRARFETNNPFVVVQKCGIRLAYGKDAGWGFFNGVGRYFPLSHVSTKLEKFIPPSEEDHSTHVLRKNMESVLQRYLEALNRTIVYKFNLSGCPAWFQNEVGTMPDWGNIIEEADAMFWPSGLNDIPPNLQKSKKWMGFAIHASIAGEEKEDMYCVCLKLGTEAESYTVASLEHIRLSPDDQLLVVYIPRENFPKALFAETLTAQRLVVSFVIDSPHIKLRTVGIRVVYQEDIQGLADAIIRCMQKQDSLKIYNKLMVEEWIKLTRLHSGHLEGMSNPKERDSITRREKDFELHSQKYRNWDWSAPCHFGCKFYGAEISKWKWFMHVKQGNSAEIPLPPNLWDDDNWLGIAICAFSRLCPKDLSKSLGGAISNSEYNLVTCGVDCDGHVHHMPIPLTEFDASGFSRDVTLFIYKPRSDECWRQCKLARATCSWSSQYLAVQSCAVGLVYNKDVEHLVRKLTSCELP